jgi:outer membrane autotransporter protein
MIKKLDKFENSEKKKRGLDELAGAEIANILSMGAYGNGNEEILERMQPRVNEEDGKIGKSVWVQGYGYGVGRDRDENSVEEFRVRGYGIEAGADILTRENVVGGVYGGYEESRGEQGGSEGEIEGIGVGLYGGWFGENMDVKGRIYGGKLGYRIKRELKLLGERAENEIGGYNIQGDILGQYNIWARDNMSITPYGQIEGGYVANAGARDKGRGGANIEIYDGSYGRMEWRMGVGINYVIGRWSLYGKVSGGYVVFGERAEYSGEFIDTDKEMEIWGTKTGRITGGMMAGAEYEITNGWSINASVSGNYYESGKGYYGNIGVNYNFGIGKEKI